MGKLTDGKIRWIVRQKLKDELTTGEIASLQGVSPSRIRQLWLAYRRLGGVPTLKRRGRPKKVLKEEEASLILKAYREYPCNALLLERVLMKRYGVKINHSLIHRMLREDGLAVGDPRKQGRKRWVRYERSHSMALWHVDWYQVKDERWKGSWLIAYEDDASRLVTGYGLFKEATADNALAVLRQAMARYGRPLELLTDRGSQFYASGGEVKEKGVSAFEASLKAMGIRHILGGVNHPQTNGKVERFFGTFEAKVSFFPTIEEFMTWYNTKRPHMSLRFEDLETPMEAFYRKVDRRRRLPLLAAPAGG